MSCPTTTCDAHNKNTRWSKTRWCVLGFRVRSALTRAARACALRPAPAPSLRGGPRSGRGQTTPTPSPEPEASPSPKPLGAPTTDALPNKTMPHQHKHKHKLQATRSYSSYYQIHSSYGHGDRSAMRHHRHLYLEWTEIAHSTCCT
jgi:hypothetical protein